MTVLCYFLWLKSLLYFGPFRTLVLTEAVEQVLPLLTLLISGKKISTDQVYLASDITHNLILF